MEHPVTQEKKKDGGNLNWGYKQELRKEKSSERVLLEKRKNQVERLILAFLERQIQQKVYNSD